jgi:hypothetical protein
MAATIVKGRGSNEERKGEEITRIGGVVGDRPTELL